MSINAVNNLDTGKIYTDFQGLARLRAEAGQKSPEANKAVAKQFEALYMQMMLKSMRQASIMDASTESDQTRFYQEMFDKQIALDLSSKGAIGISTIIEKQLGGGVELSAETQDDSHSAESSDSGFWAIRHQLSQATLTVQPNSEVVEAAYVGVNKGISKLVAVAQESLHVGDDVPTDFIKRIWDAASHVAEKLGVSTEVIVAQSALATDWGRKVVDNEQGQSSNNLLGIRADDRWQGQSVIIQDEASTTSYRSYSSAEESLDDYVSFLKSDSRYERALNRTESSQAFVSELQKSGFVTDKNYAGKINSIMNRDWFVQTAIALQHNNTSMRGY